jgi:hypothetical protein
MQDIKKKLSSRKLWIALIAALLPIISQAMGGDIALGEALQLSAGICVTYILGQSAVDAAAAKGSAE